MWTGRHLELQALLRRLNFYLSLSPAQTNKLAWSRQIRLCRRIARSKKNYPSPL